MAGFKIKNGMPNISDTVFLCDAIKKLYYCDRDICHAQLFIRSISKNCNIKNINYSSTVFWGYDKIKPVLAIMISCIG